MFGTQEIDAPASIVRARADAKGEKHGMPLAV
jgi:hypothetical protein